MKSQYEDKLVQEYAYYGIKKETIRLNNEEVIIPAEYVMAGGDFQKAFLRDYFDLQKKDLERYKAEKLKPQMVEMNGVSYIVPFKWRDKNYKDTKVVEYVLKKAKAKYNRAISLTCKMDKAFPSRKYTVEVASEQVESLQKAYNKYLFDKCVDKSKYAMLKAAEMAVSSVHLMKGRKSDFNLNNLQKQLKYAVIGGVVAGGAALSGYTLSVLNKNSEEKSGGQSEKIEAHNNQKTENTASADLFKEVQRKVAQKKQTAKENVETEKKVQQTSSNIRSEREKTQLFNRFMADIFESEGVYGDEKTIDQPTNMGIIQPTLNAFIKRYPNLAQENHISTDLKKLKRNQAKLIYRKLYFDQYRIGDYKNESIGLLIFDIYVNHEPMTAKKFIDQALKAARKTGMDIKLPTSTAERVDVVNSLAGNPEAETAFYEQMMKERKFHMYKKTNKGSSKFGPGLRNRANKFNDRYVASVTQDKLLAMNMSETQQR